MALHFLPETRRSDYLLEVSEAVSDMVLDFLLDVWCLGILLEVREAI